MSVHLELTAAGQKIDGYSSQTSHARENTIECLSYTDGMSTVQEGGAAFAVGRRNHDLITIEKRIDKATPLLAQALCRNEVVAGTFRFYQPNPDGDGTIQQFYTVTISEGRIAQIKTISPDTMDPSSSARPPTETISFAFHTKTWVHEIDSKEFEDNWREAE